MKRGLAAALLVLLPGHAARAHIVGARLGDFYAGALHPLTDPQDVLLWLALGMLAGSLGAARGRWLVLLFPAGLIAGLALHLTPPSALADAAATTLIGLMLAANVRLPTAALFATAVAIALWRGAANAAGTGAETNTILFAAGLGTVGYVLLTLTMALVVTFRAQAAPWRAIAVRACGSWIAAIGLMMGGFALAH